MSPNPIFAADRLLCPAGRFSSGIYAHAAFYAVILLFAYVSSAYAAFFGLFGSSEENVSARDGKIVLDVSGIDIYGSRHYSYNDGKIYVRFFIVRDDRDNVHAAVDACEVCWESEKGYVMKDRSMLCLNCKRRFQLNRIGIITGGCNPHPLKFDLENDRVIIATQELFSGAKYFSRNR